MGWKLGDKIRLEDGRIAVIERVTDDTIHVEVQFDEHGALPREFRTRHHLKYAVITTTAQPATIRSARLAVEVEELPPVTRQDAPISSATGKQVTLPRSVQYGGDLTLELAIAECFLALRENQITAAAKGVDYLEQLWEGAQDD